MSKIAVFVVVALGGCAHAPRAPSTVRSGQLVVADYSYDGEYISAFLAVEGAQVDARPDPPAVAELRKVRECGTDRHVPHLADARTSSDAAGSSGHQLLVLPPGIFWGRYLRTSLSPAPGPDCIVAKLGFPTYDAKTGEGTFLEVEVEMRKR